MGVRTTKGYISSTLDEPLSVLGKITWWAPLQWMLVLDTILETIETRPKLTYASPSHSLQTSSAIEVFMDDAHWGVNTLGTRQYTGTKNTNITLHNAEIWTLQSFETSLHPSGGKLNLKKCHSYYLHPIIKYNKLIFSKQHSSRPLKIRDTESQMTYSIKQHKTNVPHRLLGAHLWPDLIFDHQIKISKAQVVFWTTHMRWPILNSKDIRLSLDTHLFPKVSFPLPTLHLTLKTMDSIFQPALKTVKHMLTMTSTTSNKILFLSHSMGGSGVTRLAKWVISQQVKLFLSHIHLFDAPGKSFIILLQQHQQEMGLSNSILSPSARPYYFLCTPSWVIEVLSQLHDRNLYFDSSFNLLWPEE